MALDIQPVSQVRRVVMLVVLLVIFAGSVAFAQFLVTRRQQQAQQPTHTRLTITLTPPAGFVHSAQQELQGAKILSPLLARINGGPRIFFLYFEPLEGPADGDTIARQAAGHFHELFGSVRPTLSRQTLAGYPAVDLTATLQHGTTVGFAVIRATAVDGRFIAAVYNGDTPMVDADRQAFAQLTGPGLKIARLPSR